MGAGIFRGEDLSGNPPLTEARADDDTGHTGQFLRHVLARDFLASDEMDLHLHVVVNACEVQTFPDTLVGVLKIIFAYQGYMDFPTCVPLLLQEVVPGFHRRCLPYRNAGLPEDGGVQPLTLHVHGDIVDAGQVFALHYAF